MSSLNTIRTYVNDSQGVTYPDNHLFDSLNDSLLDVYVDTKPTLTTATWTLTASADKATLPSTIMIPQVVIYNNLPYWFSTQAELERWSSTWRSASYAQPRWFVRWSHDQVRLYPKPDQTYTMTLIGVGWPTELTPAASTVDSDSNWRQAIEHRTVAILLEMARPDLSAIHDAQYQQYRNNYMVDLRANQGHRLRQLRPGTRQNNAQSGSINLGRWYK